MARRILIVEDNDGVAHLLDELARGLGLEPVRARGGTDAIQKLQPLPAAVVCDIVLADLDGFQVGHALRALPGGREVPLVMVSGVYRKLPDPFVEAVQPLFLPKPFDPAAFRTALDQALKAVDAAQGVTRGSFLRSSPSALFVRLCDQRQTGLVEVVQGEVRRRLWFFQGQLRFGQSNLRTESAGGMQLAAGTLAQPAFDQAVAHAKQARTALHDALVVTGAMSREEAQEALRAQTAAVADGVLAMLGADWTLQQADVEKQPDARRHPVLAVLEAARRDLSAEDAREGLTRLGAARLQKSPLLDRELFLVRQVWPAETVTALVAAGTTAADLVQKARPGELALAFALVSSGLVAAETAAPTAAAQAGAARADDPDEGRRFSPEDERARLAVFAERDRAAPLNHYELLAVAPKAGLEEIRRSYLGLARRYHTDSHSGVELGSARQALETLFQRVNEAMETLGDDKRRAEYDIYIDRKAKGLPTDVAAILKAEELFQRGEILLKANKAAEALDLFREAIRLNHAEADFHAFYGYALFRVKGAPALAAAKASLDKAQLLAPELASAQMLQGLLARDQGDLAEAERRLAKALELEPKNETVQRELRFVRQRREKGEGQPRGGLLGRLFKK